MLIFWEIVRSGNIIAWILLGLGFLGTIIIIERLFNLWRADINSPTFLVGVMNTLRTQNAKEAIQICDESPGPIPHIVREIIMHAKGSKEEMYRAAKAAALAELPRMERFLQALFTIVYVAPLLGLLGTLIGFLDLFLVMTKVESPEGTGTLFLSVQQMAPGIKMALVTSILGLIIAIPFYIAYNYFRQKIDNILIEMEKATVEMITFVSLNFSSEEKNGGVSNSTKNNNHTLGSPSLETNFHSTKESLG